MTDRELLERAAAAAGMHYKSDIGGYYTDPEFCEVVQWNPLTDDGDALRLAVRLRMGVNIGPDHTEVTMYDERDDMADSLLEWNADDPCAATRRAIVRAAAAQIPHDEFVLMFPGRFPDEEVERARAAMKEKR